MIEQKLREAMEERRLIGFSPWRDAEGVLWGYVTDISMRTFTVDLIDVLGKPDGTATFAFSQVSCVDTDEKYADRLRRLSEFRPSLMVNERFTTRRAEIECALEESVLTGEFVRVKLRSESHARTIRVRALNRHWLEFEDYDDCMCLRRVELWRRSCICALRRQTAVEEADALVAMFGGETANTKEK